MFAVLVVDVVDGTGYPTCNWGVVLNLFVIGHQTNLVRRSSMKENISIKETLWTLVLRDRGQD
jgi:hypothetical protein